MTIIQAGISPFRLRDKVSGFETAVDENGKLSVNAVYVPAIDSEFHKSGFLETLLPSVKMLVVDLIVPAGLEYSLSGIYIDGSDDGLFELFRNGDLEWRGRNSAARPSECFTFPNGTKLIDGDLIELKVEHTANGAQNFAGSLFWRS